MNALDALRLQMEWGADEALQESARSWYRAVQRPGSQAPPAPPPPRPAPRAAVTGVPPIAAQALAAEATSIAALEAAIRGFDPDGLSATATSLVLDRRETPADLAFIGDAPGAEEDRSGLPFGGRAGDLLDAMLDSIGLDRQAVLLAHLLPWRPPGGRPASPVETTAYLPFLGRQLALRRVRRLVLLGTGPVRATLGRDAAMARVRGRWLDARLDGMPDALPALATVSPGQMFDQPATKPLAWADLRLLRRTLGGA